jgi:NAD-dependent DNA ligase
MNKSVAVRVATDARLLRRGCESLLGLAAGLIADGELNAKEIQFLSTWLSEHPEIASTWPGEVVYKRVREALVDGVITSEEQEYLKQTLSDLVGGSFADVGSVAADAMSLPLDLTASIVIPESTFCFTGAFLFGTRAACERAVQSRGGLVSGISKKLNYLVVGELSSRDWKYSSFGLKIQDAMRLNGEGADVHVVGEAQWVGVL